MKKRIAVIFGIILLGMIGIWLLYVQIPTKLLAGAYEVQGIDVSHYQGEIDWEKMSARGIRFAYIKATEGSSYTDEFYMRNLQGAQAAGISAGAYHFFSFDSSGSGQAAHFTEVTGDAAGDLIPVVDVEYYGNKRKDPPDADAVRAELKEMLQVLEEYYGCKPMIYSTQPFYQRFLQGYFEEYPLWIRAVYLPPLQEWTVWQYTDLLRPDGVYGEESSVDGDVVKDLETLRLP